MTVAAIFYSGIEIIVSRIIIQQSFEKMYKCRVRATLQ